MPPKGVLNSPRRLGCVESHRNGYSLRILMREHGGNVRGPTRATRAEAAEDLAKARQCTTRKDIVDFVGALSQANGPVATELLSEEWPSPAVLGLCPNVASSVSASGQATAVVTPTAPSPQAVTLRGLNIQYPFSRLILLGAKSIEARRYALGHRNIASVGGRIIFD